MSNIEITKTDKAKVCHFCGVEMVMNVLWKHKINSSDVWDDKYGERAFWHQDIFEIHECQSCQEIHLYREIWDENCTGFVFVNGEILSDEHGPFEEHVAYFAQVVYPLKELQLPEPHKLMPNEIKILYEESRQVFPISKRSSAALLRLAIQKLCVIFGGKGRDINQDIQSLLEKLPLHIQQALDIVRIVGNSAAHAGEIDVDNDDLIVKDLFDLVNEIIDEQIAKPHKRAMI